MKKPINKTRQIKRSRRTKAEMQVIRTAIERTVIKYRPMTVRQVFYQMVSRGVIKKDEAEYATVDRLLVDMRRQGILRYEWIADNTRWMRKPDTYHSLDSFIKSAKRSYRRNLWDGQKCTVAIWLEKDALAGVLVDVTAKWDVPLMVGRGYPSESYLHSVAQYFAASNRPVFIYGFGDHDPSGIDIERAVLSGLRSHAPNIQITFRRVAVLPRQIKKWTLPTRPTKKSDTRSKTFQGQSVEVDAIDPAKLRWLCENRITRHIDMGQLKIIRSEQKADRKKLNKLLTRP